MPLLFIDGSEGTTGLRIHEYLSDRPEFRLIPISPGRRKDPATRAACLDAAEIAILCLPDQAAREAVALVRNPRTRLIDASTTHRIDPDWAYGLPELGGGQRERIAGASRVSVGGCHATGFILALRPLVASGLVPESYPVTIQSLTGYSGGGKPLIARFESSPGDAWAICPYALGLTHKHLPEMQAHTGLLYPPLFTPAVGRFYNGMLVTIPIIGRLAPRAHPESVHATLTEAYANEPAIRVMPLELEDWLEEGLLSPTGCNGTNRVDLFVIGHRDQVAVLARLDNLGKGAAGGAVQCLNLMTGMEEFTGLPLDVTPSDSTGI